MTISDLKTQAWRGLLRLVNASYVLRKEDREILAISNLYLDSDDKDAPKVSSRRKICVFVSVLCRLLASLTLVAFFFGFTIAEWADLGNIASNPPFKVTLKEPDGSSGEPFFPAIVACHTTHNQTLALLEVGVVLAGNTSSDVHCFPNSVSGENCDERFPVAKLNAWAFILRFGASTTQQSIMEGRLMGATRSRNKMQKLSEYETPAGSAADVSVDIHCIAINTTGYEGYEPQPGVPVARELLLLFEYSKVSDDTNKVRTIGLEGLDIYFFENATKVPGGTDQLNRSSSFSNLFKTPVFNGASFLETYRDKFVLGQNLMTMWTMEKSTTKTVIKNTGDVKAKANYEIATSSVAPLNAEHFDGLLTAGLDVSFVSLRYSARAITQYDSTNFNLNQQRADVAGANYGWFLLFSNTIAIVSFLTHCGYSPPREVETSGKLPEQYMQRV